MQHDIISTFQENITVLSSLVAFKYRHNVHRAEFLKKWLYRGNTNIITGSPVVFIIAHKWGQKQIIKINITRLRIPTGRRQTSWLFTSAIEGLELGTSKNMHKSSHRLERGVNSRPPDCSSFAPTATPAQPPVVFQKEKKWYNVPFGQYIPQIHDLLQLQQDPVKKIMISVKDWIVNLTNRTSGISLETNTSAYLTFSASKYFPHSEALSE